MGLTMDDPEVKVQLFRFIDALPTLVEPASVRRHLRRIPRRGRRARPGLVLDCRWRLAPAGPAGDRLLAGMARAAATRMARRFIAGSTPEEAFRTVLGLRRKRVAFTADLLGEAVITEREADAYQQTCLDLLDGLAGPLAAEPEIPQIDRDDARADPPRQPVAEADEPDRPVRPDRTPRRPPTASLDRLRPILRTATAAGGVRQRRHGAVRLQGPDLRDLPPRPRRARVPRLARTSGSSARRICREAEADLRDAARLGRATAGRRSRSGWSRGRTGITRSSRPSGSAGRCRSSPGSGRPTPATSAAPTSCSSTADGSARPSAATTSGAWPTRWPRPRRSGVPRRRLRDPDAPRHGRPDPAGPWSAAGTGSASTPLTGRCCRGWRTSSAGCWRTRRTSRS